MKRAPRGAHQEGTHRHAPAPPRVIRPAAPRTSSTRPPAPAVASIQPRRAPGYKKGPSPWGDGPRGATHISPRRQARGSSRHGPTRTWTGAAGDALGMGNGAPTAGAYLHRVASGHRAGTPGSIPPRLRAPVSTCPGSLGSAERCTTPVRRHFNAKGQVWRLCQAPRGVNECHQKRKRPVRGETKSIALPDLFRSAVGTF